MATDQNPFGESLDKELEMEMIIGDDKSVADMVDGQGLTTLGAGLVGQMIKDLDNEGKKQTQHYGYDDWTDEDTQFMIGNVSYDIGRYLAPETDQEDIESVAESLYKQFAIHDNGKLSYIGNYLKNGFGADLEAYGLSREDMERLVVGAIRTAFRHRQDTEEY